MQVAIQDGAGNYWGGATFNQAAIFYNATGGTTNAWTYSTATLAGQLTNGHTYTITAKSTDPAGNTGTTTRTFVYDSNAPTVNNVNATNPSGPYKAGATIHVLVSFTEPVLVTGTPKLNLNTSETADYASGSGTPTLTFDYVVQPGDNVAALDYATTTSLITNGGSIRDAATNDAVLTLVTPGGAGSLSANRILRIDTTNPTAAVSTPSVDGSSYDAASLPASLAGSSADTGGSGVSSVQVAIQDGSGNYWGGASFNQASIFYNATGGTTAAWTYSTAGLPAQLADGHTYTITAKATDAAGNAATTTRTFVYDTTAPTVTSVTATNANGSYATGQVIHVRITFNEPISVTGTPILGLNTTPARTAAYAAGSGTSTLTFDYTIQAGDMSADLDYATTNSLTLNGGTLKDAATNAATLTLPTVGGASSLGGQKNIVIDTDHPDVISVSSSNADGSYKAGQTIHVSITFSKPVTLAGGTPTLDLNTTPARAATYVSGSGTTTYTFDYTVQAGDTSTRLDAASVNALQLNGATIRDVAANDAFTTVEVGVGSPGALADSKNIVVDTTAPTVTNVTATPATASYGAGQTVPITVSFSEAVNVTGTPTLALNTGRVATYASGSGASSLTFNYLVQPGDNASPLAYNGTGSLVLAGGTIRDTATNNATLTLTAPGTGGSLDANTAITIDTTAPTVSGLSAANANGAYKAGDVIHVQVAFGEPVTVTGTPTLSLSSGGSASYASGSGTSTLTLDYTVQPGDDATRLDASSANALGGGTIRDAAGNDATVTVATGVGTPGALANAKNLRIDTANPTETITSPASNGTTYNSSSLPANLAGSSADASGSGVAGVAVAIQDGGGNYWNGTTFGAASITFNGAGGTTAAWTYSTSTLLAQLADGHTYTITARATDAAGNQSTTTRTFGFDVTAPAVTNVSATNANGAYPAGTTIHVQLTFNKPVNVTGTPQLMLNTTPSRKADFVGGSGTSTLSFDYTIQAGDNSATLDYASTAALVLNGGTIRDAATNDASLVLPTPGASGSLSANKSLDVDTASATISSVSASNADGAYAAGAAIHVRVTFSEAVTVSGTPTLALNTAPARTAAYASGSGTPTLTFDYTVQPGDASSHLDYVTVASLGLNGGTIRDAATNDATLTLPTVGGASSLGGQKSIVIDTGAPTVTSTTVSGATLDLTFSEPLSGSPATSDFAATLNGSADVVDNVSIVSGNIVRLTLHAAAHRLDAVFVSYTGSSIADLGGNAAATFSGQSATNLTPDAAPTAPALSTPSPGAFVASATPTLSAVFGDPDPLDFGKLTFQVCTDSSCTTSLGTFDSTVTNLNVGQTGSAAVPGAFNLVTGTQYWWRAESTDSASTSSSFSATRSFTVDLTSPAISVTAPSAGAGAGFQWYDGSTKTLWLNADQTGTFALHATASDPQSGVAQVGFPAAFGTSANSDSTSPYDSSGYTFDGTVTPFASPGSKTVTATNGAGGSASDQITISADGSAPGAFGLGTPAVASTVGTGINVSASPADAGSGLRQVDFFYCDASGGPCSPSIPLGSGTLLFGAYSITWNTTGLTDGHQYALDAVATDNVGHATTSAATTVIVDNSPPALSTAAPSPVTGSAFQWYDAPNKTLWLNATQSGSFKLRANASDPDSGVSSTTFPALLGSGSNAGTLNAGVYQSSTYTFNSPSAPGVKSISATNGVTNPSPETSSDSIDVEVDGATPATTATFPLNNGSYGPGTWNGVCAPSGVCGTVSDSSGSGVAQVKVSIKDRTTGMYWGGTAFDQASQTFNTAALAGTNWDYALSESDLTAPHSYVVEVYSVDNVGNADVHQQMRFTYGSDVGGPTTALTLSSASHAFMTASSPYVLYYGTANGGGSFTLHQSATDPSGVDTIAFPDLSATTGFSGTGGTSTNGSAADPFVATSSYAFTSGATTAPGPKNVDAVDLRGNPTHDQVAFVLDNAAPTGGSLAVNGGAAYSTTTNFAVGHVDYTLDGGGSGVASSVLTVASATLANGLCGSFGSASAASDGLFSGAQGTCYRFTLTGTDRVGNVATTSFDVKVDTTPPSQPSVTFSNLSSGNTFDDGAGTLYYRPSPAGTFDVDAASTDAQSGVQGYTYSPLSGFASTNQAAGSMHVTFNGASTGAGAFTVHATNNAGSNSTDATYTLTPDTTAPGSGGLSVNGTAATGVGSSSYFTSGASVAVSTTPYSDGGSGMQSQVVTVQQAALANDSCGVFGASQTVPGATWNVSNGSCYLFTITATDHVGNVATLQTTVKVDTTAPVAPTIAYTGRSAGNTFVSGTTLYYRPSASGAFTVNANGAGDPETGIQAGNSGYTFSSLGGFLSAAQTGNHVDVTFDGSSSGGGTFTVSANNNAGVASSATSFDVVKDSAAPVNGMLAINPYSGSPTFPVTEQAFTDAGSGIASNVLTRSAPQSATTGSCPASGYTGANAVVLPNDTVPADGCYEYTLTGTDNVGNVSTYKTIVLVDTSGPTGGSISYLDGASSLSNIQISWSSGTDGESGIGGTVLERATAPVTGSTCGALGGFTPVLGATSPYIDTSVAAGNCYAYEIVVTNNAGVSSTFSSASIARLTNASPITIAGSPAGTHVSGSTLWLGPAAAGNPFTLELTAAGANGVTSTTWPADVGALAGAGSTANASPFTSAPYTWNGSAVNDTLNVTRAPNTTADQFTVSSDLNAPTGSIGYPNGPLTSHSVPVTSSAGDGDSGVAGTQVMRASAALVGSTCGSFSPYSQVTLDGSGNDTTVADNTCYTYQLVVTDNVGNTFTASSANVVQIPDITAPTFTSAATNPAGTQLTIVMSEALDASATTPADAFTVTYNGVVQPTPTGISVSGSAVTLDLASPPNNSEDVKVRYSQPGSSSDRLRDNASPTRNESANFGPVAVVNNTPDTVAPSITSASANASSVTLVFNEDLAGATPDPSAFTITTGSTHRTITAVSMSGKLITLTISPAVSSSDNVVVSYAVPALNALHDATGNTTAPFTFSASNQTPAVAAPAPSGGGGGGTVIPTSGPALVASSPSDGSTLAQVATLTLTANESVAWTNLRVTRPDGTTASLDDASGQGGTWPFATSSPGLYVIRGTVSAGGQSADVLSHFSIWTATGNGNPPAVEKNATAFAADGAQSSDGLTSVTWPAGAFDDEVVVDIAPKLASAFPSLPSDATVVDVTAFMRSTHAAVTVLHGAIDVRFANASQGAHPLSSQDGTAWRDIPQLPTLNLPDGQQSGWFRDSDGTIHVLSRELSYFALAGQQVSTKLALRIITVRRLWLQHRSFIAVRMALTTPARVTGVFIAPNGTTVAGQTIKTPTRHAGVTILRVPLRVTRAGMYRLQMHAEGAGQVVNRTAKIHFMPTRPASPVWQDGALRVAVVHGAKNLGLLGRPLGKRFVVRATADAGLYDMLDTKYRTSAAVVVVDLGTIPTYTLAELHALLPEVQIVGLAGNSTRAAYYRSIGVSALLPRTASAAQVARTIKSLVR